jgi:hypothetical protein
MSADTPDVPGEPPPPAQGPGEPPRRRGGRDLALGTFVGVLVLVVITVVVLFGLGPIWSWAWLAGPLSLLGYLIVAIVVASRRETSLFGTGLLIGFGVWILLGAGTCVALLTTFGG